MSENINFSKVDDEEIFIRKIKKWSITIEKNKIKNLSFSSEKGFAIRVLNEGKVGLASCIDDDKPNTYSYLKDKAIQLAKHSDERLKSFPEIKNSKVNVKVYDSRFSEINPEILNYYAELAISSLNKSIISSAQIEILEEETFIKNSTGEGNFKETMFNFFAEIVYSAETNSGNSYTYFQSRKLQENYLEDRITNEIKTSEDFAIRSIKTKRIDDKIKIEVSLSTLAIEQLLSHTLFPALSVENVVKNRSILKKSKYLNWNLNIYDDPTIDWGVYSYPFDDEGVESSRKDVIKDGYVKNLFSDWRFHELTGENAGNAIREDVTSYPTISPSNVVIDLEKSDFDVEDVLYIHSLIGAHTSNPVSGDFSVECMNAFLKGKPVKVMLYGNIYSAMQHALCQNNIRQVGNLVCGNILFDDNAFTIT